jgi:hypothetical protein
MALPILAADLAEGDYSETLGTIKTLVQHTDKNGVITGIDLTFENGRSEYNINPEAVYLVVQGFGRLVDTPTVREGLTAHDI